MTDDITNEKLCLLAAKGDNAALNTLWIRTERLFRYFASRLYNRYRAHARACGIELDDCFQVCWFAYLDAIKDYAKKPDRKEKFTSFTHFHVIRQVFDLLGLRTSKREPLDYAGSLDAPLPTEEGEMTLGDMISDPTAELPFEQVEVSDLARYILERVDMLSEKQSASVRCRHWDNQTFAEIAADLGVTPQRVRFLYKKALRKLSQDERIQEIYQEFYADTNFTRNVGFKFFKETGMSSVEYHLIRLEERIARVRGGGGK